MNAKVSVRQYVDSACLEGRLPATTHYQLLMNAGYYPVKMYKYVGLPLHDWLMEHVGYDNYNWTGSVFWFNTQSDATWFALNWQ
jgi:hypothetical protein